MTKMIFIILSVFSSVSYAKLNSVGEKLVVRNEQKLLEILETKCLDKSLVQSGQVKRMLLLGYQLTELKLEVQENHFIGKHVLVDALFSKANDTEGTLTFATEFRCNLQLTDRAYLPVE